MKIYIPEKLRRSAILNIKNDLGLPLSKGSTSTVLKSRDDHNSVPVLFRYQYHMI